MGYSIVVAVPSDVANHPKMGIIIEQAQTLALEIKAMLGLEQVTAQSETGISEFGSLMVTLPKGAPAHQNFLTVRDKINAFANEIKSELPFQVLGPSIDFVSAIETA